VLSQTGRNTALELFEVALEKASQDQSYYRKLEDTLLKGSTTQYRELFSEFGDYWAAPKNEFPFYPHTDAVNGVDSAMHSIKWDAYKGDGQLEEEIAFIKLMRS
jgi:hypothetical protein